MQRVQQTVDSAEGRFEVYRVGNDQPVTLILPFRMTTFDENQSVGSLDEAIQVDIDETQDPPAIQAIHFDGSPAFTEKLEGEPSREQLEYFAQCAVVDLGIFYPGVLTLLRHVGSLK